MAMANHNKKGSRKMNLKRKLEVEDDSSSDSDVAEIHDPEYTKYLFGLVVRGRLNELKGEKNVNFLTKNNEGDTLLHVAVKQWKTSGKSNLEMIKYLISKKPQLISETDKEGRTALCYVCSICTDAQCFDIIEALVELYSLYSSSSEDLNIADNKGLTPLSQLVISASNFHVKNENYDKKSVSDVLNARNESLAKYMSTIELLINKGSDINVTDIKGKDLIMLTLDQNGFKEWLPNIVNVLIKNGLKSSIKALKYALIKKPIISDILIENIDVNEKDKKGRGIFYQLFKIDQKFILSPTIQLIKILIEKGADPSTEKIHIIQLARNCEATKFELIEYLLTTFPDYNINTKDDNGETLLLQYGHNLKVLEKLIKLNADITAVDNSGNNILHKIMDGRIVITSKFFKKLLNLGLNPFVCNNKNQYGLLYIIKCCLTNETNVVHNRWLPLLKEILEKSTYYIDNSNSSMESMLIGLLEYLCSHYSDDNKLIIYLILTKIIKYTNILSTLITNIPEKKMSLTSLRCNESIKFQNLTLDAITYMLSIKKYSSHLIEFVYVMLDLGVKLSNNSVNSVTMMLLRNYGIVVKKYTLKNKSIITTLLANGHSIETSVLKLNMLSKIPEELVQYMQEIKEKFVISDYLMIAYIRDQWDLFEKYIQNCWFPPIFFVYFYIESVKFIVVLKWKDALLSYGNIPCGSPLYEVSRTLLQASIDRIIPAHDNLRLSYNPLMVPQDSPASLRDLSKYAVRFMLAKKAIAQGSSLPKLIEEDVPPTLQFLVKVGHGYKTNVESDDEIVHRHTGQQLFERSCEERDSTSSESVSDNGSYD